jgi:predicted nucleotidyltransferase component of viral defense system
MAFSETFRRQVALLIRILPLVAEEKVFALKGGTAINLFFRNLPRLSVDIDLTYLPVQGRQESLVAIGAALKRIEGRISKAIPGSKITEHVYETLVTKLTIRSEGVQILIEVNPVIRGTVYPPETRSVTPAVEEGFGFAEIQVVSFSDLYAGKFVAALDRQHPRDLFDVRDLLADEGIDDALRRAFIVYMISHSRPMSEVLAPTRKDITEEFMRGFEGMTEEPVKREELEAAREALIAEIVGNMPSDHRRFLISFERGEPDWKLLGVPGAPELPAVLWRQKNLDTLSADKRKALVARLEEVLAQ